MNFPKLVTLAGIVWIALGAHYILWDLELAAGLLSAAAPRPWPDAGPAWAALAGGLCGSAFLGGLLVYVGLQSVRGTARDTLGNGIGSIVLAFVATSGAVLQSSAGDGGGAQRPLFVYGVALLGAGIIALRRRREYLLWRELQMAESDRAQTLKNKITP